MSHPSNQYKHTDTPSLLFPNTKNGYLQYGIKDASFVIGGVLSPPKTCSCEQYTKPKLREGGDIRPIFQSMDQTISLEKVRMQIWVENI